ncbi:MAG TPA: alpha-mannosidase [Clostridiaceae bacterium]
MYFLEERINRILVELKQYTYSKEISLDNLQFIEASNNILSEIETFNTFKKGDRWGGLNKHYWFKKDIVIPENYMNEVAVLKVTTGNEGEWDAVNPQFLLYIDGKPIQGLDVNHREVLIDECSKPNKVFHMALYAYSGMKEGLYEFNASIACLNKKIEHLYYDMLVPMQIVSLLHKEDKIRIDIINFMNEVINLLDLRKPFSSSFYASIDLAQDYLQKNFYESFCNKSDVTVDCVGHTHIDVAWLWTLAQTREKAARSFSTVLNLMKEYPEYIFMSSQPQLYKYIKEDHPDIYKDIKASIKKGKWEAEGAMYLEADCNLISGESLVRQILFGKSFFKEEFNVDSKILWLPDVFGYSAALPQILKKSDVDYFMTTKISWNEYNKIPYDTFMWKGIDGSQVLTHFITTSDYQVSGVPNNFTTYNGTINPSSIMGAWQRYQQKDINDEILVSFGFGDGGGGATKEMLETARRLEKGIPGCPRVKIGSSLEFFKKLDKKVSKNKKLPSWVGELYLEYHRGTYTSMARNKKYNRKSEFLYGNTELFSSMNMLLSNVVYPKSEINKGWEGILLNQFHDIIPGSSIKEVYEDSKIQYEELTKNGEKLLTTAIDSISSKINLDKKSLIVFNSLSFNRSDIAEIDIPKDFKNFIIVDEAGDNIPFQRISQEKALIFVKDVPSKGYKAFTLIPSREDEYVEISKKVTHLENNFFNIEFDTKGNIISIYDKENVREILKEKCVGNMLQVFEDKPYNYDAWDINIYYQEKMWPVEDLVSMELTEDGPIRSTIRIKHLFLDSVIIQNIYIYKEIPRIDFSTYIDWKEKQLLLKAAFPVDIHADKATYEIQYGNVERPTHWNTSWDYARFEVCAHKWADISEGDYGVSILNDCKYGHEIKDSVMKLTLLKSAIEPNPEADREEHNFTYSIYPHKGDWREGNTVNMAYMVNCPLMTKIEDVHEGTLPRSMSFVKCDKNNVILEVVKKAEASDSLIIRLYECWNSRTNTTLTFANEILGLVECNLMEKNMEALSFQKNSFSFVMKPYEIKTFKIDLK